MEQQQVEQAVSQGRLSTAARSMANYFRFQCDVHNRTDRILREELEKEPTRADIQQNISDNLKELRELHAGFENSSLRRLIKQSEGKTNKSGVVEKRLFTPAAISSVDNFQTRAEGGSKSIIIQGYAALYNSLSVDMGFYEILAPDVFVDVLATSPDTRLLFNHNADLILSRRNFGLKLFSDDKGLGFIAELIGDDPLSLALAARIKRGIVNQCSFAFVVPVGGDSWQFAKNKNDKDLRTIRKITALPDISIVSYPAYEKTFVNVLSERTVQQIDAEKAAAELLEDINEEYDQFIQKERQKKTELERQYRYAGRIINRCKAALEN